MSDLKKQLIRLGSTNPELQPHIRAVIGSLSKKAQVSGFTGNLVIAMAQLVQGYTEEVASLAQSILLKKYKGQWVDKGHGNLHGKVRARDLQGGKPVFILEDDKAQRGAPYDENEIIDISIQIRFSHKNPRVMTGYITNENLNTSLSITNNWYKDTKMAAHHLGVEVERSINGVSSI